jgi:hydroxyethylthiazole kinase-like uncharacterized protein yjeF
MSTVLSRAQMQAMDRIALDLVGIPAPVLMEVAGRAVADAAEELHDDAGAGLLLVLAGVGNNGGDAVVAARHLSERGLPVVLAVLGDEARFSPDLVAQLRMASALGLEAAVLSGEGAAEALSELLAEASVVVDGLLGTGLDRAVEGPLRDAIERVNASPAAVVSVDLPSGLDADTGQVLGAAITAAVTVTFQFAKLGLLQYPGRELAGQIRIADIGIPPSRLEDVEPFAEVIDDDVIAEAFPPREADSHKGTYGHLLVVGGSPARPGAALLAGRAALRAGAGLVTLGADAVTLSRLGPALDELMGLELGERQLDPAAVLAALEGRDALVIGPALAPDAGLGSLLREVLPAARLPVVLDAGALAALGAEPGWLEARPFPTVLTPHPGEMARLLGLDAAAVQRDRVGLARRLAESAGVHVVLKGAGTVVASPDGTVAITTRGNAGMATAGMGDVLAGLTGALLARGLEPGLAAQAGVQLHARAGDLAAAARGPTTLVASDLFAHLPAALGELPGEEGE